MKLLSLDSPLFPESFYFGLEEQKIEPFLLTRGFTIIDHLTAEDMEKKYLTLWDGSSAGKVTTIFGFVHASVSG